MENSQDTLALAFTRDLRAHLTICEEALALATREHEALHSGSAYQPAMFDLARKSLLPRLEESLMALRKWRQRWHATDRKGSPGSAEFKPLFEALQTPLMKLLMLDSENQQAFLQRGLLPAGHLPKTQGRQPHCVADRYRRHTCG